MSFTLSQVVPWGRNLAEYRAMFALSEDDLGLRILGCGDGPASFNAEATERGSQIVSVDPIYQFSGAEIDSRIREVAPMIAEQVRLNAEAGGTEWKTNSSEGDSIYFLDPDGHRLEAHVGDLRSRLESLVRKPYEGLTIYTHDV